ncbi:hypothetical protein B1A99_17620 [Cohnella sp. CIP 111063]|uniref:glycoside hydrolase family 2 protein n=1 Tax=unclassified Cohnella TaxID=2636738 RepID=UPI000B8C1A7D|nr:MULTISPECIES: glycoside hydrolase family 2 TIM barrel-domain containing protein [unclassified Cohnella]OXS57308.1 hypothetical protein B1A99_17620 [Cohnella sp. CIP 111063]PRX70748.1 beta-galactosidase/beta-glucuronidase [Cohnella sp. SGD-V74]
MESKLEMQWEVGWSDSMSEAPKRWVPAAVPGAVQLDWANAENWGHHTYGDNWRQYEWMERKYWTYRTKLETEQMAAGRRLIFVSKGIDYHFHVRVNGREVLSQEGMFTPVELDLTERIDGGRIELEIVIEPAPRLEGAEGRSQAAHSCKPAVSYGWDWHPRLIPLGIWDETYAEIRPQVHIAAAEVRYELNSDRNSTELTLSARLNGAGTDECVCVWKVADPEGNPVFERTIPVSGDSVQVVGTIDHPRLWWPHDQGDQPLYRSEVYVSEAGRDAGEAEVHRQAIGFRKVRLVVHEGGWKEPSQFPKSRSLPPITMEINGRTIFCKGTNWVNPSIFPGTISSGDYRSLLELAKSANMNLLRIWGGGIVNKAAFFEQCDEMGLMVWQEFPLACNLYPDTPEYLRVLDQESRSIVARLRKHASVVLWCGGNELFNAWSKMTDQSLPLRLLNANCFELDPATPFLMTSPLEGMGHGHYMFRYRTGEDVLEAMPKASNTAYTEFGVPSPASIEQLQSFIPADELFPPRPGTAWESHHAFHALSPEMWLMQDQLDYYFGPYETLEQLVEYGQLLQSEGYKCIYEEARRQKPKCSMALNWCFNEAWPAAANNSIVMWPDKPKPAYYAVQASCRPVLASARIPKFVWREGDWFEPELWLLNDSPEEVPGGRLEAYLSLGSGERLLLLEWEYAGLQANHNRRGPTVRFLLPAADAERMKLELVVAGRPELTSSYTLLYRASGRPTPPKRDALNFQSS